MGATQYVQWVNTSFAVFNKSTGAVVYGPVLGKTLWAGFGGACETDNDGDPIAQYDKAANRWVMSQFSVTTGPGFFQCFAISKTPDATGAYYRYSFAYTTFPDYPKISVWPDAYYASFNMFDSTATHFLGGDACAFDRSGMLTGTAKPAQCFQQSGGVPSLLPSDLDGAVQPPIGSPAYFVNFPNANTASSLGLWKFHVDWATPASSTFTGPTTISVPTFTRACAATGTCIPQPGTATQLDALGDRLMYRLAYRNFGDHESLVVNHSVSANGTSGIRWYELRSPATTPTLFQSGTYAPNDGNWRWLGSIGMDSAGDLGLGFSESGSTMHPSVMYTGRVPSDPAGTLEAETTLFAGSGSQTVDSSRKPLTRWGDYSGISIDPVDDCTFWYTNEYLPADGAFNWRTRIGSFRFPTCTSLPARAATPVPAFDHVFVVVDENHDYSEIIGSTQAPYINGLASQNGLAVQYSAVAHPSLPNYLALTGGSTFGITTDCAPTDCPIDAPNIADRIEGAGKSWKAYMDAMPSACGVSSSGTYAVRHDPFVYYNDIRNNPVRCMNHVVPYSNLAADLTSASTTPNFAWITPDVCNDMHDCQISVGDSWLQSNLPAIFSSPAWTTQNSVLLLTWDEGSTNHVATLAVGPSVAHGYQSTAAYNHFSLLKTVESAWGTAPLASNDASASTMSDLFVAGSITGKVTSAYGGAAISAATVIDSVSAASTITDATGAYALANLAPGTHSLMASATGFIASAVQTPAVTVGQTTQGVNFTLTPSLTYIQAPQGNWVGTYGADGYALAGWNSSTDLVSMPLASLILDNGNRYRWIPSTTAIQALQSPDTSTRVATCFYDATQVRLHLTFPGAYTGTLHLYALDWDTTSRRETITVNDGSGPRTSDISSDFSQGAWVSLPITVVAGGSVTVSVTNTAGANAVLSGIFLGGSAPPIPAAPTGVTASPVSSSQIGLGWTASSGANSYKLQRSPDGSTGWTQVGTSSILAFTDIGLNPSTTYFYRVVASNPRGDSTPSTVVSATTAVGLAYSQAPQGNWVGTYGADGSALAAWNGSDLVSMPLSSLVLDNGNRYQWSSSTTAVQALQSPDTLNRRAATFYDATQIRLHLTFPGAYTGTLHLYALDWDSTARRETITVNDGSGPRTADISSDFSQGAWVSVPITVLSGGSITVAVTLTAGGNAVLSGVLLGGSTPPAPAAPSGVAATALSSSQIGLSWTVASGASNYKIQRSPDGSTGWTEVGTSTTTTFTDTGLSPSTAYFYRVVANNPGGDSTPSTVVSATSAVGFAYSQAPQGNWVGTYGADGYALAAWNGGSDLVSMPLSSLVLDNGNRYQWSSSTTAVQALQSPDTLSRRAATFYDATQIRLHLTFPGAYAGTLHLYALDWDSTARRETITVNDGSGPRTADISSDFSQGAWVSVPITVPAGGSVTVSVTNTTGANAVLSGIFVR